MCCVPYTIHQPCPLQPLKQQEMRGAPRPRCRNPARHQGTSDAPKAPILHRTAERTPAAAQPRFLPHTQGSLLAPQNRRSGFPYALCLHSAAGLQHRPPPAQRGERTAPQQARTKRCCTLSHMDQTYIQYTINNTSFSLGLFETFQHMFC